MYAVDKDNESYADILFNVITYIIFPEYKVMFEKKPLEF